MPDIELIHVLCPLCSGNETRFERTLRGFTLKRCQGCNFVYVNPQYSSESLVEIYTAETAKRNPEELAALYARIATPKTLRTFDEILQRLENLYPAKGRLLDFGCAAGYFYERALQRGWEAHGVDMGEWFRFAAARRGLSNMHIGCLEELQFPDAHFDVVPAATH